MGSIYFKKTSRIFLMFFLIVFTSYYCNAQITYPTPAQAVTRGFGENSLLTVRIVFPSACANPVVTINLGTTNAPGFIEYMPGSIIKIGGTVALNIAQSNISNLASPVFTVSGSPTAGQDIIFTIKRRANCGTAASTKDAIVVSGSCSFSETDPSINTYNLLAPALTITPPAIINNVNVGSSYSRNITITNGGNGCMDTLGFTIKYNNGSLRLDSLKLGTKKLTVFEPPTVDTAYFELVDDDLTADSALCNGEPIVLTEYFTVLKCGAVTTYKTNWFEFGPNVCQTVVATANVTMSSNLPNINISIPTPAAFCPDGNYSIQSVRVINSGAGAAINFKTTYWSSSLGAYYLVATDTSNWVAKDKLGNILGNMIRVPGSAMPSSANLLNSTCIDDPTWFISNVQMTLPNLIIQANDTIYIEYRVYHNNVTCAAEMCHPDYYGWANDDFAISYDNQCGTGTNSKPRVSLYSTGYPRAQYQVQVDPDINAGIPFSMNLNYFTLASVVKSGTGRSYIFIKLPANFTLNGPITSTLTAGYPSTLNSFQSNDTLFIDMLENTNGNGKVTIPLIATCGSGGAKAFKIGHLHWWDSTACTTFPLSLSCQTANTNLHCPSPCPKGGATPVNFQLKRITYGYPDANNDNLPDAFSGTPVLSQLNLKNTLNGDTVLGTWNIKVYPNVEPTDPNFGLNFTNLYIDFPLSKYPVADFTSGLLQYPYKYNPQPNAVVSIYNNGSFVSNCTVTPSIINNIAHYDISSCKATWVTGDSLVVDAKYVIGGYADRAGYAQAFTTAEVYATYAPQATPTTAPIAASTYTCDHFQNYVDILNSYTNHYSYAQQINGCVDRTVSVFTEYSLIDNGAAVKFPYEARLISTPDTVVMRIPPGFDYEVGSAQMLNQGGGTTNVPAVNVTLSGNILKFVGLKSLFLQYGGTKAIQAEYSYHYFYYKVIPTCSSIVGFAGTQRHEVITAGNGLNTPLSYHENYPWGGHNVSDSSATASDAVNYNAPQPIFTGGGTIISNDGTASWNVVLQNGSNTLTAPNSWFYINPTNGIT
ncbi:MAG: hypothetical protein ABL929_11785, partial [Ferruginibacter sp.]